MDLTLDPAVAMHAIADVQMRTRFVTWVASKCQQRNKKDNRLSFYNDIMLKAGGVSSVALDAASQSHGYML